MNVAPRPVGIDDKYELREGVAFMTGVQALVRVPLEQAWRDREAGLTSGTLISSYRGSPIAALDQLLHRAKSNYFEPLNIHVAMVNEEIRRAEMSAQVALEICGRRTGSRLRADQGDNVEDPGRGCGLLDRFR
jgi:indolepyruvate ferredoxin oxidoreductase